MITRRAVALAAVLLTAASCSSTRTPSAESTAESTAAEGSATTAGSTVASTTAPTTTPTTVAPEATPAPTTSPASGATAPIDIDVDAPRTRWVAHLSGPTNEDEIDGVAAAPDGSLYVTGKFELTATLGGSELVSSGRADIPLARVAPDGTPLWVTSFGGPGEDNIFDIDADVSGAVLTGIIEGEVQFGDHRVVSAGSVDCVVLAVDPEGDVQWARSFGGLGIDGCNEVTIAADGSIVTSLDTDGGWDSPAGPMPDAVLRDTLLMRLDRGGAVTWARRVGGAGPQRGKAISVAPDGSVAFGGESFGDVEVEGEPHVVPGTGFGSWLTRWTSGGDLVWTVTWGGAGRDFVKGVLHDEDALYAVGPFIGQIDVQGTVVDARQSTDLVVARFELDGGLDWVTSVQGVGPLTGAEVASAPGGGVLLASTRPDGLTIRDAAGDRVELDDTKGGNAWLALYRPDGSVGWASTIEGAITASPDEISRSGTRVYLDMTVRGDANSAAGDVIDADRKDSAVWAIDIPG
jgi:hypothetical protein